MKSIFENVISRGNYDLTNMLSKIDTYYIEGKLTESERDALYAQARNGAVAALGYDVRAEIDALWAAVRALQSGQIVDSSEIKDFVQPTGAHDAYNTGDKVLYNGKTWKSIIDGNVWRPDVYPAGWVEVS